MSSIVWFRRDLRLGDNHAFIKACDLGDVLPIYILDDIAPDSFQRGGASNAWLQSSLRSLNESLEGKLNLYQGNAVKVIESLIEKYNVKYVFLNTCYEPWHRHQELEVAAMCKKRGLLYKAYNSNYLWDAERVLKNDGSYYKVFSAYKKKALAQERRAVLAPASSVNIVRDPSVKDLLETTLSKWQSKILSDWEVGEKAAYIKLHKFIDNGLNGYKDGRNYPYKNHVSMLSPHLSFGEISPAQIYEDVPDAESFLNEIIWREFSAYLLYHFQDLHAECFNQKFKDCFWQGSEEHLHAWQAGHTGYPLIDAGMRQLWKTGYMHNRVRMVAASFLVKNLGVHWHRGRDWFWECLLDADLANNSASWQWVAGCGADAAPYYRIFNPITQGEKFDPQGEYTRRFVGELARLPDKYLFKPWEAPEQVLRDANITLGKTYPLPIVDVSLSRNRALADYKRL